MSENKCAVLEPPAAAELSSLEICGDWTIDRVMDLKGTLETRIDDPQVLEIVCSRLVRMDTAGFQLMLAFHLSRKAAGLSTLVRPDPEILATSNILGLGGLLQFNELSPSTAD